MVSIHAPHTGSDVLRDFCNIQLINAVSIHAPHTGSDHSINLTFQTILVSIHAPHTGSDSVREAFTPEIAEFQSTLPTRGATWLV